MTLFGEGTPSGVDLDALRKEWAESGLLEVMNQIVETFLDDTDSQLAELRDVADAGDCDRAAKIGHALKSSTGSLHAARLSELCREIELAGKAGDAESVRAFVASAEMEFSLVRLDLCEGLAA